MGDPHGDGSTKTASVLLPPGCRFYPSEEQLLCYYLTGKNTNTKEESYLCGYDLISELDLYDYGLHELPERASYVYGYRGKKRHWYCYCKVRVKKGSKYRRSKNGYWKRKGGVRDVVRNNDDNKGRKLVLGTRTSFVFYSGNCLKTAVRTDWFMHEYALVEHVKASFVLCRVFIKSHGGTSVSEVGLSSAAEESVSAVRHIGIQHDGFLTPDIVEAQVHDDNVVDRRNDTSRYPVTLVSHLDEHPISGPVSDVSFHFPGSLPPNERGRTSGLHGAGMCADAVVAQQLLSILEEDFIELNDLLH